MFHKWTQDEIEMLLNVYPDKGILECMKLLPFLTKNQIKRKVSILKIKSNRYTKWTKDEDELLIKNWATASKDDLKVLFPNRNKTQLMNRAQYLGLKCEISRNRNSDLSFLELNSLTPNSAYWWGYIMADGHISKNSIMISSSYKDVYHLNKLSEKLKSNLKVRNYINTFTNSESISVCTSASDIKKVSKWREMLDISNSAKTYFPPNLSIFEDLFIYFFIGFVDGDGCIWNQSYPVLKIEIHNTWLETLKYFEKQLIKYGIKSTKVKIGKKNTAILTINNRNDLINISRYCNKIDYLERKWNIVLNCVKIHEHYRRVVTDLYSGKTYESISKCIEDIGHTKQYIKKHTERFIVQ